MLMVETGARSNANMLPEHHSANQEKRRSIALAVSSLRLNPCSAKIRTHDVHHSPSLRKNSAHGRVLRNFGLPKGAGSDTRR
jgi:hypothetical protein